MKVTAFNKYTGEKIYELEMKECEVEHIADVSRFARLGESWAHMNDIPIQREYSDSSDTFFAAVNAGIAAAEYSNFRPFDMGDYVVYKGTGSYQLGRVASYSNFDRENIFVCYHEGCTAAATKIADLRPATVAEQARAVQEGRSFGYHRFDVSCPDYTPEHCYTFCPQFDGQEVR